MSGTPMAMPEWYDDAKEQMNVVTEGTPAQATFQPVEFEKLEEFPHLFAEFDTRESDVLIHFFPRAGLEDRWTNGYYTNRCHLCKREVEMPKRPSELKPCPSCQHTGLVYIPGRVEEKAPVVFPQDMKGLIKEAVDQIWLGDVAVEEVPELGAFSVQIQDARNTAKMVGSKEFVGKICAFLNELLSEKN